MSEKKPKYSDTNGEALARTPAPTSQVRPEGYDSFLEQIKSRIQAAKLKAALAANREMLLLYWEIGRGILERQASAGWGAKVIDRLSRDLQAVFPALKGLSPRNLKYMRRFAREYPQRQFVQEVLAQIPWSHNLALLEKVGDPKEREWYLRQTVEHGWSRSVLVTQIESRLYQRQGGAGRDV